MTPLYVNKYPPAAYGIFTHIYALASMVNAVLAFGMETTYFRYLQKVEERDKPKVFNNSFIVISTYASFVTKRFKDSISMFPDDTLLIADEAHNVGANQILKEFKKLKFNKRIGLSATPERIYDDITNLEINKLFNDSHPFIVSFTMAEALKQQILCSYKYYPVLVELTESESQQYYDITIQIAKIYASSNGDVRENESLKRLLLIRSSIINKATNKLSAFKQIISEIYNNKGKLEYMLVYTPEGSIPEDLVDELTDNLEDMKIIDEYTVAIRDIAPNIYVSQYTSNSKNRSTILENFESGSINVLTSMKCLDEGVDIPRSEVAIFCSSTGNPRQFIQRRGRVLRRHPNKTLATIYDLVVVPSLQRQEKEENFMTFNNINRKLIKKELKRVYDFSSLSINYTFTEYPERTFTLDKFTFNPFS
jgi:superfamily II DNA or RNA helicase